jgi:hypothetical protein
MQERTRTPHLHVISHKTIQISRMPLHHDVISFEGLHNIAQKTPKPTISIWKMRVLSKQ